jgi:hypothetical protein
MKSARETTKTIHQPMPRQLRVTVMRDAANNPTRSSLSGKPC